MIIVRLKGGLGNQMFQYACGKALSLRNGEKIKLDITGYERTKNMDTPRKYSLSHFNISASQIASNDEIRLLKYPLGIISKGWRFARAKIFRQFNVGWNAKILEKKGNLYLDGFWQTEKYFMGYADIIRREFSLKKPMGMSGQAMAEKISKELDSVSLHIRRGDVARDVTKNPYAGICTQRYYEFALKYIGSRLKKPHVFIFSDDPKWVVNNVNMQFPFTIVSDSRTTDYEELILMSKCNSHIISNSTFSWWGAWLDPKTNKIVVAPKKWKKWTIKDMYSYKDIYPKSWIRI